MHSIPDNQSSSFESQKALKDLEALGYDVTALMRMNMNDQRIVDLRDKAFRFRGIQVQEPVYKQDTDGNEAGLLNTKVESNVGLELPQAQEMGLVECIIYLAEKQLCED